MKSAVESCLQAYLQFMMSKGFGFCAHGYSKCICKCKWKFLLRCVYSYSTILL